MQDQNNKWNFKGRKGDLHTTIFNTAETVIVPGYAHYADGSPIFADLYGLIIGNTSVSNVNVTIRDGKGGSNIRDVYAIPAGETLGFIVHPDGARQQKVGNVPWTAQCSASVNSVEISALFYKNS